MSSNLPDEVSGPDVGFVRVQIRLVLTVVFLVFVGQSTLNPILAPLTRALDMHEWQAGAIVSSSSLMIVLTSRFWGRRAQIVGRQPVLITSSVLCALALLLFAGAAHLGMIGALSGVALFALLLLTRGALFGTALSATFPASQAFIAEVTPTETERVRGMAGLGAVQGFAMITGSVIGGLLAGIDLVMSLVLIPVAAVGAAFVSRFGLAKQPATDLIEEAKPVSARDSRVWPFLVISLGVFTVFGMIQITAGFILQDRFEIVGDGAPIVIGLTLLAAGAGMLIAQGVVVPRSQWPPRMLIRVGSLTATIAFLVLLIPGSITLFVFGIFLVGLGVGTAIPGAISAPTLLMQRDEQGGLAGTLSSTNGLSWMITPLGSTVLYSVHPLIPMITGLVILLGVTAFAFTHPKFATPAVAVAT